MYYVLVRRSSSGCFEVLSAAPNRGNVGNKWIQFYWLTLNSYHSFPPEFNLNQKLSTQTTGNDRLRTRGLPPARAHINIVIGKCVRAQFCSLTRSELDVRRIPAQFNWTCPALIKKIWSQNNLLGLSGDVLLSLTGGRTSGCCLCFLELDSEPQWASSAAS